MKTYEDLKKQWLEEHYAEYREFTQRLLSYAVASMAFLLAFQQQFAGEGSRLRWLAVAALGGLLASAAAGMFVAYEQVERPRRDVERARRQLELAALDESLREARAGASPAAPRSSPSRPAHPEVGIEIRRVPSPLERAAFRVQAWTFLGAYAALIAYGFLNLR